jgi:hypothetical protein
MQARQIESSLHLPLQRRFFKQAPDTSIFTEDVRFLDHIGPRIGLISSSVVGKKAYTQHIWLLRFHTSLFFSRCEVSTCSPSSRPGICTASAIAS